MDIFSNRMIFAGIAAVSAAAMLFALYLQYFDGLEVCPLCLTQRVFVVAAGATAVVAALHGPGAVGQRVYALLTLLFTGIGVGFAGRHVWLQSLPEELAPACGPSLEYMLETLPFSKTLEVLLMGDGNCAEVVWTFLGFSIPQLTLALFIAMSCAAVAVLVRSMRVTR